MDAISQRWRSLPRNTRYATIGAGVTLTFLWYVRRRRRKRRELQKTQELQRQDGVHQQQLQFAGKTVMITGAAGDIGGATARAFARKGARLVLVDLPSTEESLNERKKQLVTDGAAGVHVMPCDVSKNESVKQVVEQAVRECGHVDCFFNNAGILGELCPLHKQTDEWFRRTIEVNLLGVFHGMKYVGQAMVNAGVGGVIINTASSSGLVGVPNMAAYVASKFAVVGLTKTGSKDLGPHGIRVCAVAPSLLEGKMWSAQIKGHAERVKRERGV